MKRFKLGLCEWAVEQHGLELCSMAKRLGFDGIQLGYDLEAANGQGLADPKIIEEYMQAREVLDIEYTSVSVTALDDFSMSRPKDDAEYEKAMGLIYSAIDVAEKMNIGMVMCPSFNRSAIVDQESFDKTVDNYREICEYSNEKGIIVSTESTIPAKDMIAMVKAVGEEKLKIYFDTQNHYLKDRIYMPDLYKSLVPYICEIHVKDGVGDDLSGALLGCGSTGFFETAQAIVDSDYSGYIVIENYYNQPPLANEGDSETLLIKDIETIKKVFHM